MPTKRNEAIRQLGDLLYAVGGPKPPPEQIAAFVDTLIDAARAPESAHTRALITDAIGTGDSDPRR